MGSIKVGNKFAIGDKVWLIKDNKVQNLAIILIVHLKDGISYGFENGYDDMSYWRHTVIKECAVFAEKEELLKSI